MISEGSCDTKDWSNDAEKSALLHSRGFQTVFEPLWPKTPEILSKYFNNLMAYFHV